MRNGDNEIELAWGDREPIPAVNFGGEH